MSQITDSTSLAKVRNHLRAECFNKLYIGGRFVGPIDGEKYPTYYPATGELLHEFPRGKANDVEAAIAARTTSKCSPRSRPPMSANPSAKRP